MIFDILISTVSCLIFQWFISFVIVVICGKPKKRPVPASSATSGTPKAKTPQQPSTATTQNSSNVTFDDGDKNKSCYGLDDGVFKPKKGTSAGGDEKPKNEGGAAAAGGGGKEKKKSKESEKKSSKKVKKDPSKKKIEKEKKNNKDKENNKNDDSDKTDLRSLTLEKNLAEAKDAKITKNPAAIDRSNRLIEGKDAGATSGYALPIPKKEAQSSKDAKKNGSAYLN